MTEQVSLKNLIVPSIETECDFPGLKGFKVKLSFISRENKAKMLKDSTITKYVKHQAVTELDEEKFSELYSKAIIKGWSGLKYRYVQELVPSDIGTLDPDTFLDYSVENAEVLLTGSESFEAWVIEIVGDLENFTKTK